MDYQKLFNYIHSFGVIMTNDEMDTVIEICKDISDYPSTKEDELAKWTDEDMMEAFQQGVCYQEGYCKNDFKTWINLYITEVKQKK